MFFIGFFTCSMCSQTNHYFIFDQVDNTEGLNERVIMDPVKEDAHSIDQEMVS